MHWGMDVIVRWASTQGKCKRNGVVARKRGGGAKNEILGKQQKSTARPSVPFWKSPVGEPPVRPLGSSQKGKP